MPSKQKRSIREYPQCSSSALVLGLTYLYWGDQRRQRRCSERNTCMYVCMSHRFNEMLCSYIMRIGDCGTVSTPAAQNMTAQSLTTTASNMSLAGSQVLCIRVRHAQQAFGRECLSSNHLRCAADARKDSHQHDKISVVLIPQILDGVVLLEYIKLTAIVFRLHDVRQLR